MAKIQWVVLPLLIAAALLAAAVLRGRPWSRRAVNIGSSVLLLAYVATTAGLGIFWVANQQLPVFDWHYLFGYATVLLLALHLAFNLPTVWTYVARRLRRQSHPDPPAAGSARRGVLGALGLGALAGAAYLLGLRQRTNDLTGAAPAALPAVAGAEAGPVAPVGSTGRALVERFHALSSHTRTGVVTRAPSTDWRGPPPAFKRHADVARTALPPIATARAGAFDLATLGAVLGHTAGVTETRGGLALRASPSSGGLFATELYLLVRGWPHLDAGAWHYEPDAHALARLTVPAGETGPPDAPREPPVLAGAPLWVVATAVFRRTAYKYGDRAYRYVLADLGHALENLRVAARAFGLDARGALAFDEARIARALRLDETEEGVLAVLALQTLDGSPVTEAVRAAPATAAGTAVRSALRASVASGVAGGEVTWQPAPPPRAAAAGLVATAAMHAATSLRAKTPVVSAAPAARSVDPGPPAAARPLPRVARRLPAGSPEWLHVIATRRSVRRYASAPLSLEALSGVLAHMATAEATPWSPAVRIHLAAAWVAGLEPGVYRYDPSRHALVARESGALRKVAPPSPAAHRAAARAAALDQDVIGDAAAVFVLTIDRATFAADPLGAARGYRHAFLEAGCIGERVYLEAIARGLGACAVGAFYDAEAAALVGVDPAAEWVVHFAAVGPRG